MLVIYEHTGGSMFQTDGSATTKARSENLVQWNVTTIIVSDDERSPGLFVTRDKAIIRSLM